MSVSQARATRPHFDSVLKAFVFDGARRSLSIFFAALGAVVLGIFAARRVFQWGPSGGDASVWFSFYEWVGRGHAIYSDVWDHKDLGFLWVNSLVYASGGVLGVYVFSLGLVGLFGFSIFLITQEYASKYFSFWVAVMLTAAYVSAPSFLSVYTEHFAITLIAFASALLSRFPLAAGAIFAVASSVKLGSIIVFITALIALLIASKAWISASQSLPIRLALRSAFGFFAMGSAILVGAQASNLLSGWFEVISYNREYSSIRNASPFAPKSLFGLFQEVISGPLVGFSLFVGFAVFLLIHLSSVERDAETTGRTEARATVAVAGGVAAGSIIALVPQIPPSYHHLHFAVGGLLVLIAALAGRLHLKLLDGINTSRFFGGAMGLFLFFLVVPGVATSLAAGGPVVDVGVGKVRTVANQDLNLSEVNSVAVFGYNSPAFDPRALPGHVLLKCRLFYQFNHMIPRYGDEIAKCLDLEPDIVLVDRPEVYFGNLEEAGFGNLGKTLELKLGESYVQCSVEFRNFKMFARSDDYCGGALAD